MKLAIQTLGTRGDVQPYVALALGLMTRGHEVQMAAPVQFESLATSRGINFAPLPGEFLALMDTPEGKAAIAGGSGFSAGFKLLKHVRPLMRRLLDDTWAASRAFAPDGIVYHPKSFAAPHIAERLQCPVILASPLPGFTPTAEFASPLLPFASLGPLNRISHQLAIRGADTLFSKLLREWRVSALGLTAKRRGSYTPDGTLYAYSEHVVPRPADWGDDVLVSGYWFLDEPDWQIPVDLAAFLAAGPAPIYIGFGSMPSLDPADMTRLVIEALARSGKRGLLASGGGAIGAPCTTSQVHTIAAAPHGQLFRHVAAAVHHGGAGTTGAALRAGLPSIICPFFGDQPFWGRRVEALGAGPAPLNRRALTADVLAAAFAATGDATMRSRAAQLGETIRSEDGVGAAVDFVEAKLRR